MQLTLLPPPLAVCRLDAAADLPLWAIGRFVSCTRTDEELSIVCEAARVPADVRSETGWRAFKVAGPLELAQVGVLSALAAPLAAAGVSVFVVSTFDTDYLLVKEARLAEASRALEATGHTIVAEPQVGQF